MKEFNIFVNPTDLKMIPEEAKFIAENGFNGVFENVVNHAIHTRYPQGIGGRTQRTFARILNKLDATKDNLLQLEEDEFELLKNLFTHDEAKFPATQTRLIDAYVKQFEMLCLKHSED
jgi:hypothetical protein